MQRAKLRANHEEKPMNREGYIMEEQMRLFIAIDFSDEIKKNIDKVIQDLKKASSQGSFTHPENLHLTLAFIGETTKIEQVKKAMDQALGPSLAQAFTMRVEGLGRFKRQGGDIYWLGIPPNDRLGKIHHALTQQLKSAGFPMEERKFKPHLTLGRRVILPPRFELDHIQKNLPAPEIPVHKISLMQSRRIKGKLTYTEVYSCSLND